jgi:agmatine deiminase
MKRLLFLLCLLAPVLSFSQNKELPKGLTNEEIEMLPRYRFPVSGAKSVAAAPAGPKRAMAEWEEIQTLVIRWSSTTTFSFELREIVRYAREECEVLIICNDSNVIRTNLTNNGIPLSNIRFLITPSNSIWMRDYGANPVYLNDVDSLVLVDWIYNRPRPLDDTSPSAIANYKGIPIFETVQAPEDLVHTGGNYMSDGFGNAFSSELVSDENGTGNTFGVTVKSNADIDSIMKDYMGISNYIKMPTLPYDGIHHIDMHMKLLDEETLVWAEYPTGVSDGPQIEANLQYVLNNHNSVFGTPYRIVRVPAPFQGSTSNPSWPSSGGDYMTYSNSVFVNKTLLVPIYNHSYDNTALNILRDALPGYRVQGINCTNIIAQSGAIHCITHSIGVADPLLISHQELRDTYDSVNPYEVKALVKHKSGIQQALLFYTTDTASGNYQTLNMNQITADQYSAFIPAQAPGTEIFYYIQGNANSGKQQVRPIVAPQGHFSFKVLASPTGIASKEVSFSKPAYPNPANAITVIPVSTGNGGNVKVDLFDIDGRLVKEIYHGVLPAGERNIFLDCSEISAGAYFIRMQGEGKSTTQKLMIR